MECIREQYNDKIDKNILKVVRTIRSENYSVQNAIDVLQVFKWRQKLTHEPLDELKNLMIKIHPDKNKFPHTMDAFIIVNDLYKQKKNNKNERQKQSSSNERNNHN